MSHWIWPWNWFKSKEVSSRDQLDEIREKLDGLLEVLTGTVDGLTELPAALEVVTESSNARIDELTQQINEEKAVQALVGVSTKKVTLVASNINQLLGNAETEEDGNTEETSREETSTD
ncbi:MAG: hypothetical protein H8D23_29000 [Candidatus Brocadiales bacterium]|nr:hypothetical protein [Candidatus Brocadiales bacterium]